MLKCVCACACVFSLTCSGGVCCFCQVAVMNSPAGWLLPRMLGDGWGDNGEVVGGGGGWMSVRIRRGVRGGW